MTDSVSFNATSLRSFAREMREAAAVLDPALARNVRVTAESVAGVARGRWSFSSKLPGRIRVRSAGTTAVVYVESLGKPHEGEAAAFEHHGDPGDFEHPVFGHKDVKVRQAARPALGPALKANETNAVLGAAHAVDEALRRVHSHG